MSKFFKLKDPTTGEHAIFTGLTKAKVEKFLRDQIVVEPATTDEVVTFANAGGKIIPTDVSNLNPTAEDAVYAEKLAQPNLPGKVFAPLVEQAAESPAESTPFAVDDTPSPALEQHL